MIPYARILTPSLGLAGVILLLAGWLMRAPTIAVVGGGFMVVAMLIATTVADWRGFRFTLWIGIANLLAMLFPGAFQEFFGFRTNDRWLMLIVIQLIMFGMGTQMKWSDFTNVLKMPLGVIVGITCQFTIMPLLGYGLAKSFSFSPEIAVGLILIGSCSSGLASNVMTFLAKGNLALSVTLTAIATAMAPIMTPLWMKILASSMVHVDVVKMGLDIVNTVIVPILAAFVHDFLLAKRRWIRQGTWIVVAISTLYLLGLMFGGWSTLLDLFGMVKPSADALSEADFKTASVAYEKWVTVLGLPGFVAAAFTFGAIYHLARQHWSGVAIWMPRISMAGIVYFTLVATANGRDRLLEVGAMLVLAVFLHNMLGYLLGYWCSRLLGMNRQDARTIAIEVGTQNGSMAVSLAQQMGKIGTVGLAGVIFAPMMNITGSILANHWRKTAEDPVENLR